MNEVTEDPSAKIVRALRVRSQADGEQGTNVGGL
jgi:hypothetical protein